MKPGQPLAGCGPFTIRGAEAAALMIALNAAALAAVAFAAFAPGPGPLPRHEIAHKVDLRFASEGEITLLPGIGPARASRIAASLNRGPAGRPEAILADAGISAEEAGSLWPHVLNPEGVSR